MAAKDLHWNLLAKAAERINPTDFSGYFALQRLSRQPGLRREFQTQFARYYRLHLGRLSDAFTSRYLELLVTWRPHGRRDPYTPLLLDLYRFPRRKGDHALQASFVSKLVAFRDESRPLYDRHVARFFGVSVPSIGPIQFRISGFVENLERIRTHYETWSASPRFGSIVRPLFLKNPNLRSCHKTRLCDFLVWTVGAYGIE